MTHDIPAASQQSGTEEEQVGARRLYLEDPSAGSDVSGMGLAYNRATSCAGFPTIVGAVYAHCIDERIPAISGYGTFCASVGSDALYGARDVS